MELQKVLNYVLDNMHKVFFPEEWIRLDLTVSKTELLTMLVVERYGEVIMSEIADHINAPLSTTTGLVNRLVKNRYLQRERSEEDRRIVVIRLTEEGRTIVREFKQVITSNLKRINEILSEEEQETVFRIVMKLIDALRQNKAEIEDHLEKHHKITKISIE
ncbi:MAG: hypothetical protein AWM53_00393 [Candidatus Dichloromethanomonas elyunquensis]|nr:MAG: hypothetical protein AWM53_00393 [Candidatus Dichloromethanomonas elyunquensis]